MSAVLTLFHNEKTNQLTLITNQFNIGNQYSNNTTRLILSRNDKYTQYIPYLIIQPEYSKPFAPIQFTHEIVLSNIFTQTTYIDVQVVLKSNTHSVYSNVIRLNLTPAIPDSSPLDVNGFYNRSVSVIRASKTITKSDLRIETLIEVNYDDIIQPHELADEIIPPYVETPENKEIGNQNDTSSTTNNSDSSSTGNVTIPENKTDETTGTTDSTEATPDNTGSSETTTPENPDPSTEGTEPPITDTTDTKEPPKEDDTTAEQPPVEETPPVDDTPIPTPEPERPSFDLLINTPFYTMNSNRILVFLNGRLLTQPEYLEIGNGISNTIVIHSLRLNPDDKLDFVVFD